MSNSIRYAVKTNINWGYTVVSESQKNILDHKIVLFDLESIKFIRNYKKLWYNSIRVLDINGEFYLLAKRTNSFTVSVHKICIPTNSLSKVSYISIYRHNFLMHCSLLTTSYWFVDVIKKDEQLVNSLTFLLVKKSHQKNKLR